MTEDPKPIVKPDPTPPDEYEGHPDLAFKITSTGHEINNEPITSPKADVTSPDDAIWSPVYVKAEMPNPADKELERAKQAEFRRRLHLELGLDGQLYDRLAQVELTLDQFMESEDHKVAEVARQGDVNCPAGFPKHLWSKVGEMRLRDDAKRNKLRMEYLEEAEEERDEGRYHYREVFLHLAKGVENGEGSVAFHKRLLADYKKERDVRNEGEDEDQEEYISPGRCDRM